MFCPNCGKENQNSSNYCTYCGSKLERVEAENKEVEFKSQDVASVTEEVPANSTKPSKTCRSAVAGLVLSLVGILFAGMICGTLGVIFSSLALTQINKDSSLKGKGMATAGLVISIIDVVVMFLYFMI